MALEAVIFPQDPFIGCYFKDLLSSYGSLNFDHPNQDLSFAHHDQFQYSSHNSSPPPPLTEAEEENCKATIDVAAMGRRKRRRRSSSKNKEEVESQRMTHIAVERNRRKQMNEYLAVIRSLMPPSYVQRGDQASIIGGAINYVKELEQLLQSLEVQKTSNSRPKQQQEEEVEGAVSCNGAGLFRFPQYSRRRGDEGAAAEELEVNMADGGHANLKILLKRKPSQLLKLVAGFQAIRLSVLHVNVTTIDASLALYSFSLKVEEGCRVHSVEEIAGAANHIVGEVARIQ